MDFRAVEIQPVGIRLLTSGFAAVGIKAMRSEIAMVPKAPSARRAFSRLPGAGR